METEYAICFQPNSSTEHPTDSNTTGPDDREIFEHVLQQLAWKLPIGSGYRGGHHFLANGSAVSWEARANLSGQVRGLVEGATPECFSPLTVLTYQKAQDEMFAATLGDNPWDGQSLLLKCSSDSLGHIFGQQESYEVEIARGWRLALLRAGLCAIIPLVAAYWLIATVWLAIILSIHSACRFLSKVGSWVAKPFRRLASEESASEESVESVAEADASAANEDGSTTEQGSAERSNDRWRALPPILMRMSILGLRCMHGPIAMLLTILLRSTAIVPLRTKMASFLASRQILDGSGHIDGTGKFWISAKAMSIDSMIGLGGYWGERPIFVMGHWLEELCARGIGNVWGVLKLFRRYQRIQIGLADSCMTDLGQYLRMGTTALVLDMLEQGEELNLPRLRDPLLSLKSIARDDLMIARNVDRNGTMWNALELQRAYAEAVRKFLQRSWRVPNEAWKILRLWEETLDALQKSKHDELSRDGLIGQVDWLTKKWLLGQVAPNAPWAVRKKVDIRYHELSAEGYFQRVSSALGRAPLVATKKVEQAKRVAPEGTPAMQRGYLIREFSEGDQPLRVDWDRVTLGKSKSKKVHWL